MTQHLSLVYFAADPLSGRRSHWSLFLHPPSLPEGTIYEAQGGLLQMTYGRVPNACPTKDPTFRGEVALCEFGEGEVGQFEGVTRDVELPSSSLKVPVGYHRRDCQDWVRAVVNLAVERGVVPVDVEKKLEGVPELVLLEE
jgi:hypothetical protein